MLLYAADAGGARATRNARLRQLRDAELDWLEETIRVERRRRAERPA